jgi:hypothetical protein
MSNEEQNGFFAKPVLAEVFFYLDLADEGYWLIKSKDGKTYTAGYDKQKVQDLIKRLNENHRPNIHQGKMHEVLVCWNDHDKGQKCDYVTELKSIPKTALMKSIQDIKSYVKSLNTEDNKIYKDNELLIMSCFSKAMEIIESNLLLEKQQIVEAVENGGIMIGGLEYFESTYGVR